MFVEYVQNNYQINFEISFKGDSSGSLFKDLVSK